MAKAVSEFREQFDRRVAEHDDWGEALVAVLRGGFELTEWEVLRLRVLTAEHGRIARARVAAARGGGPRERARAASATSSSPGERSSPAAWSRACCPSASPQLLTRAVIGLYNSVWVWYRPGGSLQLADVGRFFVGRQLDVLGCDPTDAARWLAGGRLDADERRRRRPRDHRDGQDLRPERRRLRGRGRRARPRRRRASSKSDIDGLLINGNGNVDMEPRLQMALGFEDLTMLNVMSAAGSTSGAMVQYAALALDAGS